MSTQELIQIKDAAKMLGVTTLTLRNWDKAGKLTAYRHPINNYRVYRRSDIEKILDIMSTNTKAIEKSYAKKKLVKKLNVLHL
ncbi:MAG: MerR family DNA-binding transcriptional regulator [Candidatus Paceibacterota bacterium]|jgi:DNA-binding transcriptional MerR regulator